MEAEDRVTYLGTGIGDERAAKRYLKAKWRQARPEPLVTRWPVGFDELAHHLETGHGYGEVEVECIYPDWDDMDWPIHHVETLHHAGSLRLCRPAEDGHVHVAAGQRFYVSAMNGPLRGLLLGPYASHMMAILNVNRGRRLVGRRLGSAGFSYGYGTASSARTLPTVFGR
jgi:hypothetical protein